MGHDWFTNFDRRVCYGRRDDVEGVCPKLRTGNEGLLSTVLDGTILGELLGIEGVDKCGVCGCSIVGLDTTNTPPSQCERRERHTDQR